MLRIAAILALLFDGLLVHGFKTGNSDIVDFKNFLRSHAGEAKTYVIVVNHNDCVGCIFAFQNITGLAKENGVKPENVFYVFEEMRPGLRKKVLEDFKIKCRPEQCIYNSALITALRKELKHKENTSFYIVFKEDQTVASTNYLKFAH